MDKWLSLLIAIAICIPIMVTFFACEKEDDDSDDNKKNKNDSDDDDDDDNDDDDVVDDDDDDVTTGFVSISSGVFTMGSPESEPGRNQSETQHTVTLTNNFEMSMYETTQGKFTTQMGWNPSNFGPNGADDDCGDECPVESLSWFDALVYANALSSEAGYSECYLLSDIVCKDMTNVGTNYMNCMNTVQGGIDSASIALHAVTSVYDCEGYRLPTESEWEYAARAGTLTAYNNGLDSDDSHLSCQVPFHLTDIAWYCGNASSKSYEIGQKLPNPWNLYDMSGNVWEWTWDWYNTIYPGPVTNPEGPPDGSGNTKTCRGGSWDSSAKNVRSASRAATIPSNRYPYIGFRLARSLP